MIRNTIFRLFFLVLFLLANSILVGSVCASKIPTIGPDTASTPLQHHGESILLVHGLLRTYLSMWPLKTYFEKQGYTVHYYKYCSTRYSIHEHALMLHDNIVAMLEENPKMKLHFITHSLGGVIVREALTPLSKVQLKQIGAVVMLAPPNQGSYLAKISLKIAPMLNYFVKPLAELSSEQTAYVHQIPIPEVTMGIIAGRFDAKVPPASARLAGVPEPVIVNATHTFIMNHNKTKKLIKNFIEKGAF